MNNLVYIVDVRNLILGNESTLERHLKYADSLQLKTKSKVNLGVIQFKRQKVASLGSRGNLQILSLPSNPLLMARSLRQMKSSDSFVNLLKCCSVLLSNSEYLLLILLLFVSVEFL